MKLQIDDFSVQGIPDVAKNRRRSKTLADTSQSNKKTKNKLKPTNVNRTGSTSDNDDKQRRQTSIGLDLPQRITT